METKKVMDLIRNQSIYKLVITAEAERKIRHLCQKIPDVEWSGALFYTYEGSIEEDNLVITCRDLFLMDIGSAGYTEFDMSPDVISYMADNPELLDMQLGLIHSHNTMATFFSGTDTNTLKEEGKDRNHFVSLIVNNAGVYTAAITRKVKSVKAIQETYGYNSFNDLNLSDTKEYTEESEYIEYFMLDITKEGSSSFKELDGRIKEIKETKENKKKESEVKEGLFAYPALNREPFYSNTLSQNNIRKEKYTSPFETSHSSFSYNHMSKEDVHKTLVQMLTGSVVIRDYSKIDTKKWAESLPDVFGKRFGKDEKGFKRFGMWAESHCEFLLYDKMPETVEGVEEESYWLSCFAMALHGELASLSKNKYIDTFKEILEQWII